MRGVAMDWLAILLALVGGGIGGNGIAAVMKNMSLGTTGNTVAGAIGGALGTWLVSLVPGLNAIVGGAAGAAASGSFDFAAAAGQGIVGIIAGAILTALASAIKNSSTRSA